MYIKLKSPTKILNHGKSQGTKIIQVKHYMENRTRNYMSPLKFNKKTRNKVARKDIHVELRDILKKYKTSHTAATKSTLNKGNSNIVSLVN